MLVSLAPPRATRALSVTEGVTPSMCSIAAMSSMSAELSPALRSLPVALSVIVPAPMEVNESDMLLDTPETVVISAMTAVTPIMIPRIVRKERRRFCVMFATDILTLSTNM